MVQSIVSVSVLGAVGLNGKAFSLSTSLIALFARSIVLMCFFFIQFTRALFLPPFPCSGC